MCSLHNENVIVVWDIPKKSPVTCECGALFVVNYFIRTEENAVLKTVDINMDLPYRRQSVITVVDFDNPANTVDT